MDTDTFKRIVEDAIKPLGNTLERIAKIDGQAPVAKPAQHPFLDAVYADAKDNAKTLAQALSDVTARNPALAADYRRSQTGGSQQMPARATAAAGGNAVVSPQHEFFDVVMAHAKANNIPVDQALQDCVLSHPDLAEDYRASIIQHRK
jgi:hypothetical protein